MYFRSCLKLWYNRQLCIYYFQLLFCNIILDEISFFRKKTILYAFYVSLSISKIHLWKCTTYCIYFTLDQSWRKKKTSCLTALYVGRFWDQLSQMMLFSWCRCWKITYPVHEKDIMWLYLSEGRQMWNVAR